MQQREHEEQRGAGAESEKDAFAEQRPVRLETDSKGESDGRRKGLVEIEL